MTQSAVITQYELVGLLAEPLGDAVARQVVREGAESLGLGDSFDRQSALRLLERIALKGGLVGISARFTMSRLHLRRVGT